eukprot:gene16741-18435_t
MGSSSSRINTTSDGKTLGYVDNEIIENCVVVFSTTTCKYCDQAKQSLNEMGVRYKPIEIDLLGRNSFKVSSELSKKTGLRTVPQIFINGNFIGGYSEMQKLKDAGRVIEMVYQCANSK